MVIINLILFIILFSLAIILADSFNALRIGSIFTLSMWVIVLSGLIHYLIFRKFQEKFNLPTTVLTMVEYYIQWILMSELGESDSISCDWVVILSLTTLSRREKPILNWF